MIKEKEELHKLSNISDVNLFCVEVSKFAKRAVELVRNGNARINISKANDKKPVYVDVCICEIDPKISVPSDYNSYMNAIQMTIGTMMDNGFKVATAEQIYRIMNGLSGKEKVSKESINDVEKAVKQMKNLEIEIDRTEEFIQHKKILEGEKSVDEHAIAPITSSRRITNRAGITVRGVALEKYPPIYKYSKSIGQIRSIPYEVMKIEGRNSKQKTILKFYLLQQIESMKPDPQRRTKNKRNNTIKIDTIFNDLKHDIVLGDKTKSTYRVKINRRITDIDEILTSFKNKQYISDFTLNKKNNTNTIESITIILKGEK